jgi:hypothetical protein
MIDTLRFARRMRDAGVPADQAEAIAEGFAEETRATLVTRDYLDNRLEAWAWRIIGTVLGSVAAMLLANLAATWAIVASHH